MPSEGSGCRACSFARTAGLTPKRLIICCDGAFPTAGKGPESLEGNVSKLCRVLSKTGVSEKGERVPQVVYYQSGVGLGFLGAVNKYCQGAFGGSLAEKVFDAYQYLVNNWAPDDEIFLFGFSRGAYTVRSLAGFICDVGLLPPEMMQNFFEIYEAYQARDPEKSFDDTHWANQELKHGDFGSMSSSDWTEINGRYKTNLDYLNAFAHRHVSIKAIGVWDTVGSLGMTGWVDQPGFNLRLQSSKLCPKIRNAFQALALDETRGNFPPSLFYLDKECEDAGVRLKQCWFPGYHADIGGYNHGLPNKNNIDEVTFAWMCDQLYGLLQISVWALRPVFLFRMHMGVSSDELRNNIKSNLQSSMPRIEWSEGALQETDAWKSLWWVVSLASTLSMSHQRRPGESVVKGKGGVMGDHVDFCEEIHPSVWHRMQKDASYRPKALRSWKRRVKNKDEYGGKTFEWAKDVGKEEIRLKEYVLPWRHGRTDWAPEHFTSGLELMIMPSDTKEILDRVS